MVVITTITGSISTIIQATIAASIIVQVIEPNRRGFQARHAVKHRNPSSVGNELERDEARERHPGAEVAVEEAVSDPQAFQGRGEHLRRADIAVLHPELLQRGAAGEIEDAGVALDADELQPGEVLGGEGPVLQRTGEPGRDGDPEPEVPDLAPQRAAEPAVDVALHLGDVVAAQIQIDVEVEVDGVQGCAPAADVQQGVDEGAEGAAFLPSKIPIC